MQSGEAVRIMKEYVDELMKGFDGDYQDFCNYVYKDLDAHGYRTATTSWKVRH